jgi:hypothetical protein
MAAQHNRLVKNKALEALAALPDAALHQVSGPPGEARSVQSLLYAALRREQAAVVASRPQGTSEPDQIMSFARAAYHDLVALLGHEASDVLDTARDGDWSLRDLLRHAIAVELRYREQVLYSAGRRDDEPLAIPASRLPCDRLAPPEPAYAETAAAPMERVLALVGQARQQTDERLATLSQVDLGRPSLWGQLEIDVRERMHQIGVHLVEVILQAEKMIDRTAPGAEARRIVKRIESARAMHQQRSGAAVLSRLDAELEAIARDLGAR